MQEDGINQPPIVASGPSIEAGDSKNKVKHNKLLPVVIILAVLVVISVGITIWLLLDKLVFSNTQDQIVGNVQSGDGTILEVVADDENVGDESVTNLSGAVRSLPNTQLTKANFLPLTEGQEPNRWYDVGNIWGVQASILEVVLHTSTSEKSEKVCGNDTPEKIEPTISARINWEALNSGIAPTTVYTMQDISVVGIDANDVTDIFVGAIGQEVSDASVFFLMKDGTVEYTPSDSIVANKEIRSYGKIPGVEKVINIGGAETGDCFGWRTVVARRIDGKFYDLGPWFNNR